MKPNAPSASDAASSCTSVSGLGARDLDPVAGDDAVLEHRLAVDARRVRHEHVHLAVVETVAAHRRSRRACAPSCRRTCRAATRGRLGPSSMPISTVRLPRLGCATRVLPREAAELRQRVQLVVEDRDAEAAEPVEGRRAAALLTGEVDRPVEAGFAPRQRARAEARERRRGVGGVRRRTDERVLVPDRVVGAVAGDHAAVAVENVPWIRSRRG